MARQNAQGFGLHFRGEAAHGGRELLLYDNVFVVLAQLNVEIVALELGGPGRAFLEY